MIFAKHSAQPLPPVLFEFSAPPYECFENKI